MVSGKRVKRAAAARDTEERLLSICILSAGDTDALRQRLREAAALDAEAVVSFTGGSKEARSMVRQQGGRVVEAAGLCPADARNAALASASGHWLLSIDEDESLEDIAPAALSRTLEGSRAEALLVAVETSTVCEGVTDVFQHRQARLVRNLPSLRFDRSSVHCAGNAARRHGHAVRTSELTVRRERSGVCCADRTARIESLREDLSRHPDDPECLALLGREMYAAADYRGALDALRRARQAAGGSHPLSPYLVGLLATTLREAGRMEASLQECEGALRRGLSCPELQFARGWALMALRRPGEAAEAFAAACRAKTAPVPWLMREGGIREHRARMGAALALLESGRAREAAGWAEEAASRRPDLPETLVLLAVTRDAAGDRSGAIAALEMALLVDPCDPDALSLAAPWFAGAGMDAKALAAAERLCEALPDDAHAHLQRAAALASLGEPDRAHAAAARALALSGGDPAVLMDAGRVFAAVHDPAAALRCFQEVIVREPSRAEAYFAAGEVMLQAGAFPEAADIFRLGIRLDGSVAAAHFGLGNALARSGRLQSAVRAWERALELDPSHQEAAHNLTVARRALSRAA